MNEYILPSQNIHQLLMILGKDYYPWPSNALVFEEPIYVHMTRAIKMRKTGNTGDFMKKVHTATCTLRDRYI